MAGCPIHEYLVWIIGGVVALTGFVLLRAFGKNRLSCGECFFALWYLFNATMHSTMDTYLLYGPRISAKAGAEPKADDIKGCFMASVQNAWREYGKIDSHIFKDDFQPTMMALTYGMGVLATAFTFLVFLGHFLGAKWAHPMQIVAGMWHFAMGFAYTMPEHFAGYPNVSSPQMFWMFHGAFMVVGFLSVLASICHLSCGSCGSVCPVASGSGDKKKKQ